MVSSATKTLAYKILRIFIPLYLLALAIENYLMHEYLYFYAILAALFIYSIINIRSFRKDQFGMLANQLVWLFFITYASYRNYSRYKDDTALFSYSKPFNHVREKLGIPLIPASWHLKEKGFHDIEWVSKDSLIGHDDKLIVMTADRRINFETDNYRLKPQGKTERYIYARYVYASGKHPDTLDYSYAVGDSSRTITRPVADSILTAEHIQKDY